MKLIDTGNGTWVHDYAGVVKDRAPFEFVDGAGIGFDPSISSLMEAIGLMKLPIRERIAVMAYAATGAAGMTLVAHGIRIAPGPTKVPVIGIGALVALISAGEIKHTLTGERPARVKASIRNGAATVEYGWPDKKA